MAVTDFNKTRDAAQLENCLAVLHVVQALPMVSGNLMSDANEGESYECLVRQLKVLHENIVQIALHAKTISSKHYQ